MPFSSPRDLPDPGIEPESPALQADSLPFEPPGKPMFSIFCTFRDWFKNSRLAFSPLVYINDVIAFSSGLNFFS